MAEGQIKIMDATPFLGIMVVSAAVFLAPSLVNPDQSAKQILGAPKSSTSIAKSDPARKQNDEKKKQPLLPKTEAVIFDHQARTGTAMRLMARGKSGKPSHQNFPHEKKLTQRKLIA